MKKNQGYTLMEMIIVIAIMAILTGSSFAVIAVIKQARLEAATSTLNNQIGALVIETKAISNAGEPKNDAEKKRLGYPLSLALLEVKNTVKIDDVTYQAGSYVLVLGHIDNKKFYAKSGSTVNVEGIITKNATIEYVTSDTTAVDVNSLDSSNQLLANCKDKPVSVIQYNKSNGSVIYGAGEYKIHKYKVADLTKLPSGSLYSSVFLDKASGNHYSK